MCALRYRLDRLADSIYWNVLDAIQSACDATLDAVAPAYWAMLDALVAGERD